MSIPINDNRMHRAYSTYPQTYPDQARIDKPAPMRPVDIIVRLLSSVCGVSLWITSVSLCHAHACPKGTHMHPHTCQMYIQVAQRFRVFP